MIKKNFAIFILTHGRADRVLTVNTLRKCGYTGKIYLIVDTEDSDLEKYIKNFGDEAVQIFDKNDYKNTFDRMDCSDRMNTVVFARNANFDIAKKLGYEYFLQLDDDYTSFHFRFILNEKLKSKKIKDFDKLCEYFIDFLEVSNAKTVTFAQGGDFLGGAKSSVHKKKLLRKAMNSFFCKTSRPFQFVGIINEDTNTYVLKGSQGDLFFSVLDVCLVQLQTQKNKGGLTDEYLASGTFVKSFYSVIAMPSAVKVSLMGQKHRRIHHHINWNNCVPKIINEKYKKKDVNCD